MTIRDIENFSKIVEKKISLGLPIDISVADEFQQNNKHLNFMYGVGIDSINSFFMLDNKFKNNLSEPMFKILKGNKFLNDYATFFSN